MKKIKQLLIVSFIALISSAICFTGCDSQLAQLEESNTEKTGEKDSENEQPAAKTGTITGKALYSNADDNSGIIISLEKTEESISASVASAICSISYSRSLEELNSPSAISRSISGTTTTASDGSYKFENVEAGTYTIYASSNTSSEKAVFTNVSVSADATATVSDLKLTATGNISGIITLDGTTTGNEAFLVFVAGTSYMAMTDSTGKYTISGVPAGKDYQLIVTKGKLTKTISSSVTVTASGNTTIPDINFKDEDVNGKEEKNPFELKRYFREPELCLTYTTTDGRKTKTLSDNIGNPTHLGKGCYKISINLLYCISAFSKEIYHSESSEEYTISELLKYDPDFKITSSSDLVSISEDYSEMTVNAATDSEQFLSVIKVNLHFNPEVLVLSEGYTSEYYLQTNSYEGVVEVDYTNYLDSGNYSIIVKNNTDKNLVCFKGSPSEDSLIGGVPAFTTSGLRNDTSLFKASTDFILYLVTYEDYIMNMNLDTPFGQIYCYYNADTPNSRVYEISSHLGGDCTVQTNNTTIYTVELRERELYGSPIYSIGSMELENKFQLETQTYTIYPVFRKLDKKSGEIISMYSVYSDNGKNFVWTFDFNNDTRALRIEAKHIITETNLTMSPTCAYLEINNSSNVDISLYQGYSTPLMTTSGYSVINKGKYRLFDIQMDKISSDTYTTSSPKGGFKFGNEIIRFNIEQNEFKAGYLYSYVVRNKTDSSSSRDLEGYFVKDTEGKIQATQYSIDED